MAMWCYEFRPRAWYQPMETGGVHILNGRILVRGIKLTGIDVQLKSHFVKRTTIEVHLVLSRRCSLTRSRHEAARIEFEHLRACWSNGVWALARNSSYRKTWRSGRPNLKLAVLLLFCFLKLIVCWLPAEVSTRHIDHIGWDVLTIPKWKPSENIRVVLWVFTCHEGLHKLENLWALDLSLCFLAASVVVARILWFKLSLERGVIFQTRHLSPQTFQVIWLCVEKIRVSFCQWVVSRQKGLYRDPEPQLKGTHSMDTYFSHVILGPRVQKTRQKHLTNPAKHLGAALGGLNWPLVPENFWHSLLALRRKTWMMWDMDRLAWKEMDDIELVEILHTHNIYIYIIYIYIHTCYTV